MIAINWQVALLILSSNLDDLSISFFVGLRRRVPVYTVAMMATISAASMATGLLLGDSVSAVLPDTWAEYISAAVFFALAVWFLHQGVEVDDDTITTSVREEMGVAAGVMLGSALGINSLTLGFSGGLAGFSLVSTSLWAGIVSLTFLLVGTRMGGQLNFRFIHVWGDIIAGGFLLVLGLLQII